MERLREELEQLFGDLWRGPRFALARPSFRPAVDVFKTEDPAELNVVVDLAGVDPDSVQVVLHERTLVVAGVRPRPEPDCPRSYYHLEIQYGPFERRVTFPEGIAAEGVRAAYERGLLTVVLPIAQAPVPGVRTAIPVQRQT